MGRQIFIDDYTKWYQHAKHATLGGLGACPPGKFRKIGLLRLNLRAFSHQNVTLVSATLLCGIPLCLEVPGRLKPSSVSGIFHGHLFY